MDYMSMSIDHDIPIMSVLDLKDIAGHRVCCHGLDEVQSGFLELYGVGAAVAGHEKCEEVIDFGATHFISRRCIRYNVNDSTLK